MDESWKYYAKTMGKWLSKLCLHPHQKVLCICKKEKKDLNKLMWSDFLFAKLKKAK